MAIDWQRLTTYAARYEVDIPVQQLEHAGIPVIVKGEEAGIWGPAFPGPTSQGITVLVPSERLDEARDLLELDA